MFSVTTLQHSGILAIRFGGARGAVITVGSTTHETGICIRVKLRRLRPSFLGIRKLTDGFIS